MADDDRIVIRAELQDDVSAAAQRIEERLRSLEREINRLGHGGARSGAEFAAGVDGAAKAADNLGDQARQAEEPVKKLGDEAVKSGAKAKAGSKGFDDFAKRAAKANRNANLLGTTLRVFKFAGVVTGLFALAGGASALGAGAAIAVAGVAPMVGVVAGALPIFAAMKLATLAWKLANEQLLPSVTRVKNQFSELGPQIAKGGLGAGVDYFANSIGKLVKVSGKGLSGIGAEIGATARSAGDLARSAPFLDQVNVAFAGLRPITRDVSQGLLAIVQALLNVLVAALPMAQDMASVFRQGAEGIREWTAAQLANGNMSRWLMKSWVLFSRAIGVLVDFLVGLFNILRVGAGYAGEMGTSLEQAARDFRAWTASAEGQARITRYFQDSLPALREMGRLLGMAAGGLAGLGANQNVAPLLAQIRTEFAPALGDLVAQLSGQGGLGPALISAAAGLARLAASLDFSGLTMFVQAVAALAQGVVWITQHVPGASFVVSALVAAFLGFKLLGPVFSLVAGGAKAFLWIKTAAAGTGQLTLMQKVVGKLFTGIGSLATMLGGALTTAITAVGTALKAAFVTSPIGWVVLAVIAVVAGIVLLWNKCAWFRDLVMAVWGAIRDAAVAAWNWIKGAWDATVDALVGAARSVGDFFVGIWRWVSDTATSIWNGLVTAWRAVVDAIVTAAMWIWDHGLKQVFAIIRTAFEIEFKILKFIVQTAIYIILGIIFLLAKGAEKVWAFIRWGAEWLWNNAIKPVFDAIVIAWNAVTEALASAWRWVTGLVSTAWNATVGWISARWNEFWAAVVAPVIGFIRDAWNTVTAGISAAWSWTVGGLSTLWNGFWASVIAPVITFIRDAWNGLVGGISAAWSWVVDGISSLWHGFTGVVSGVIEGISGKWKEFTGWLGDTFRPVGEGISKIWEGIKNVASGAADIVKGAWDAVLGVIKTVWNAIAGVWNSIPDYTIPDWVPWIGGKTIGLPKLATLWHGGEAPAGKAIVGEHGPEPLVVGNRFAGMLGARGPEIADIPRGGYVVPHLGTLAAMPGLTKTLPASVAAAVARSVPGYAEALRPAPGGSDARTARALERVAAAVASRMPPVTVTGTGDVEHDVYRAWKRIERERAARGRYEYTAGGG